MLRARMEPHCWVPNTLEGLQGWGSERERVARTVQAGAGSASPASAAWPPLLDAWGSHALGARAPGAQRLSGHGQRCVGKQQARALGLAVVHQQVGGGQVLPGGWASDHQASSAQVSLAQPCCPPAHLRFRPPTPPTCSISSRPVCILRSSRSSVQYSPAGGGAQRQFTRRQAGRGWAKGWLS